MRRLLRSWLLALLALVAAGCARGPDETELASDVQARLDALFGRPVLVLRRVNRQGSASFGAAPGGAKQAIVYFNATFEFVEAYDPSDWEGLSPQLIAAAVGATDEGVIGLATGAVAPGSLLRAYGSIVYRLEGGVWRAADVQLPQTPAVRPTVRGAQGTRAHELMQRLAQIVDSSPGVGGADAAILAEELDRALQNIRLRLDHGSTGVVIATGPRGGEYERFVASVAARVGDAGRLTAATTAGSVENAFLLDRGKARFGLVQSDVAAAAVTGEGVFAATGPLRHLRAVASLYPEQLHVIVRAEAGVDTVAQLAQRRIALGEPGSGTRHTALRVLAAHGLVPGTYAESDGADPSTSLEQLAIGAVDAVVLVVSAPWEPLSRAASGTPLRLLPLEDEAIARIVAEVHGVLPLVIPARTYRDQTQPVSTVAATALLVATSDTPEADVATALETIFASGAAPGRGVSATRLSRENALAGITIPLHEGAVRYFDGTPPNR